MARSSNPSRHFKALAILSPSKIFNREASRSDLVSISPTRLLMVNPQGRATESVAGHCCSFLGALSTMSKPRHPQRQSTSLPWGCSSAMAIALAEGVPPRWRSLCAFDHTVQCICLEDLWGFRLQTAAILKRAILPPTKKGCSELYNNNNVCAHRSRWSPISKAS